MARDHLIDHNKPVFDHFHPKVYMIGLAFVVWFALAAWVLFDHKFDSVDDMALPLAMISALLLFVILIRDFAYREIDTILGESKRLETLKSRR